MSPAEFELGDESLFTPNGKAEPLPLWTKPESKVRSLKRRAIIIVLFVVGVLVAGVAIHALQDRPYTAPRYEGNRFPPTQAEAIRMLPSDYSKIKKPPVEVKSERPPQGVARDNSDAEAKLLAELRAKRLQKKIQAQESDVSFSGIDVNAKPLTSGSGVNSDALSGVLSGSSVTSGASDRDNANRQDDKNSFLNSSRKDEFLLREGLRDPASPYLLSAGTIIPGLLITGINSDLPGQILGQVSQNVYDTKSGNYLLLPQGTKILGTYDSRITYGQERVLVVWTRLMLPNGKTISLEGMPGADLSGYAGLSDQVDNHYWKLATGVLFGSLLGAGAQIAQGPGRTIDPSYGQLALEGVAKNTNEVGQELTRKNLEIQPTLIIRPGWRFNIFVTKDVILEEY